MAINRVRNHILLGWVNYMYVNEIGTVKIL